MVADGQVMPLHAQVAEALGWTQLQDRGDGLWIGVQPETGLTVEVPPYGLSWCSTGPLVNRFELEIRRDYNQPGWAADSNSGIAYGDTPCEAIARVVVEIHRKKDK